MIHPTLCAAIPIYKTGISESEVAAFKANVLVLASHAIPVYLVTPESLNLSRLPPDIIKILHLTVPIRFDDAFFVSTRSYDFLMMSDSFYKEFASFSYLLVCQLDALVLSVSTLYDWMSKSYSYVGAPWFYGCDNPVSDALAAVGNGGFSLRNVNDHLFAIKRIRSVSPLLWKDLGNPQPKRLSKMIFFVRNAVFCRTDRRSWLHIRCHEDYFFGVLAPGCLGFRFTTPSPQESVSFSYEVNPRKLHDYNSSILPAGCHAWERYDRKFWLDIFAEFNLPILRYLSSANESDC